LFGCVHRDLESAVLHEKSDALGQQRHGASLEAQKGRQHYAKMTIL
jgi:hypothetical protein